MPDLVLHKVVPIIPPVFTPATTMASSVVEFNLELAETKIN